MYYVIFVIVIYITTEFWLKNGGEYREQENMEVWLHLKLVLENSGEHRAHREPENMEY